MLSVIIPTRNRAVYLRDTLKSILNQTLDPAEFEIIVVDNGSIDNTAAVVEEINKKLSRIRYIHVYEPGLHVGRHTGARNASGDSLVYADDDIIASSTWLESIYKCFQYTDIALVGGKILPLWEGKAPEWVNLYINKHEFGWWNGYLSLLDFGDQKKEISPIFVFGCNYAIRKKILFDCGGFNPDGMPQELVRFRGDGETALSQKIKTRGFKALYEPKALVYHRVTEDRLTVQYFCTRAYNQGISDSFSRIRAAGGASDEGTDASKQHRHFGLLRQFMSKMAQTAYRWPELFKPEKRNMRRIQQAYEAGYAYHQNEVTKDPELLKWVLRENYLDAYAHQGKECQ